MSALTQENRWEQAWSYFKPVSYKPIRETVETLTRFILRRTWITAAVLCLAALTVQAHAETTRLDARVIWLHQDRAYLASKDSLWLGPGATLHFFDRGKEVGTAEVTAVHDAMLIAVRLTSGSLERVKHLDRIEVFSDRAALRPMRRLRVGYPSGARNVQPFFACGKLVLDPHGYRADTLGERSYLLVRDSTWTPPRPEPDTVLVRLFDDTADEEIALERGELDAAVFWPGEASTHIREAMRWTESMKFYRARGVLAWRPAGQDALFDEEARRLEKLNADLFRGDLQGPYGARIAPTDSRIPPAFLGVDPTSPARAEIERALNQGVAARDSKRKIVLTYLDIPVVDGAPDWVFLMACPVICRPELRPYFDAIDLSALVNLFDCEAEAHKP